MTKENMVRVHRIYNILLSISIILAGICLIAGCLTIYFTGERTYSREIVAQTFSKIAIPIYICLALTLGGFIWEFIQPLSLHKMQPQKQYGVILKRLYERKDLTQGDEIVLTSILNEQKHRKLHVSIRTLLIVISSIVFLAYALNGKHFHQSEINSSMIRAMWVLIPCMLVPFIYAVFTTYYNNKSLQREIELLKQVPTLNTTQEMDVPPSAPVMQNREGVIRYILLLIGVACFVYGFFAGGTIDVLTKAINICTECIGLG